MAMGMTTLFVGALGIVGTQRLSNLAGFSVLVSAGTLLTAIGLGEPAEDPLAEPLRDRVLALADRVELTAVDTGAKKGLAGIIFYGGIEEVLSGWVLGQIPDGDDAVEAAQRTLVDVVCAGFAATGAPTV